MKILFNLLVLIISFASYGQDSCHFNKMNFRKIKSKKTILYSVHNFEDSIINYLEITNTTVKSDSLYSVGKVMTPTEVEYIKKYDSINNIYIIDDIRKCSKIKIGEYEAYIVRFVYNTISSTILLYIVHDEKILYTKMIADYSFGESGFGNLASFVKVDKKNKHIYIQSYYEEKYVVYSESDNSELPFCETSYLYIDFISINMDIFNVSVLKYESRRCRSLAAQKQIK
ncbi:MAG: hypothetical protein U0U66_05610 [Cytophagaceae bacterium]